MKETPTISGHAHSHTTYASSGSAWVPTNGVNFKDCAFTTTEGHSLGQAPHLGVFGHTVQATIARIEPIMTTRIVRVFILDPNENLNVEDRILFKGEEKVTDLTDQELFFELSVNDMLTKHNEKRMKILDKVQSNRTDKRITLEPVRIRDLKMTVLTVAQF